MKRLAPVVIISALFVTCAFGETPSAIRSVKRYIGTFKSTGGSIDYKRLHAQLGIPTNPFHEPPIASISTLTLGRGSWKLLKLSDTLKTSWQYLLFREEHGGKWRYAGNIDFGDQHYEEPAVSSKTMNGRSWLIFELVAAYGTGIFERREAWYSVGDKIGNRDLSYLSQGYFSKNDGAVESLTEYTKTGLNTTLVGGNPTIAVSYKIVHKRVEKNLETREISKRKVTTHFVWSGPRNCFVPLEFTWDSGSKSWTGP